MVNNRYMYKRIAHAIEHIERGSPEIAISLLKSAVKDDKDRIREGDKDGKRADSKS